MGKWWMAMAAVMLQASAAWAQVLDTPRLSFDGFGTLGVVHSDEDQADFVSDVAHSAEDQGLAEAIIAMGRSLSLTVVAECVETAEQADFLRARSCDEFQGFYINEPMPAGEFARLVRGL